MQTRTGRLVNHDPRSRAYAAPAAPLPTKSWLHAAGPVLNQGRLNGCVGFTGADWLNSAVALGNRRRYNDLIHEPAKARHYLDNSDGRGLYELATQRDPFRWTYPPTDNGSSALGLAKALKAAEIIDGYRWTFTFESMLATAATTPVMLGLLWTEAMSDPDSRGIIRIGSAAQVRAAQDAEMGHEVLLRGVNWPRKLARIRNHWTADWGIKGDALIPLDDLEQLIIKYRGDVMVPQVTK